MTKFQSKWVSPQLLVALTAMSHGLVISPIVPASATTGRDGNHDTPVETIDFNRDVRPILSDNCFQCHGPDEKARHADLRLDSFLGATAPLKSKRFAIVPGDIDHSELITRVRHQNDAERMPPPESGKRLTPHQMDILRRWIQQGAHWPAHWAFVKPERPALPAVENTGWLVNPVDSFILMRLEQEGLSPSPQADRHTLIRRVAFDLTGLPPTIDQLDQTLFDERPNWYEELVDRLLDSKHYGERMAQHWLDLARYADSDGHHVDGPRSMWPFRDYVIDSFNTNKPFDRFTLEQLAGDLIPEATLEQKIASAFHRNVPTTAEAGANAEEYMTKYAVDRVNTTATVWLGVTMQCAQCHDHKYDPFTTKEFYQLLAFFNQVPEPAIYNGLYAPPTIIASDSAAEEQAELDALNDLATMLEEKWNAALDASNPQLDADQAEWEKTTSTSNEVDTDIKNILQTPAEKRSEEQNIQVRRYYRETHVPEVKDLKTRLTSAKNAHSEYDKTIQRIRVMADAPERRTTYILLRGNFRQPGDAVQPGVPKVLGDLPPRNEPNRLTLARWLVRADHPLAARVTVNRFWQMFFGQGIVKTLDDFGSRGEWPSHPELLDWLAMEFVESGWDVKRVLRLLVTSATYRQSSKSAPASRERDPENRLLGRGPRVRLPAEMVRDNALAISGLFDRDRPTGGPSVKPYQPPGLWRMISSDDVAHNAYQQDHGGDLYRRGLYTFWKRSIVYPAFAVFDAPSREICTAIRPVTNTPLQAFVMLNDLTYVEAARVFAQRVMVESDGSFNARLDHAFRLALARMPQPDERRAMTNLYRDILKHYRLDEEAAQNLVSSGESPRHDNLNLVDHATWTCVCSAILNLDETLTKE